MTAMHENPGLAEETIAACLDVHYGLEVASVEFLPLGLDLDAAAYKVVSPEGSSWFLKVRFGPVRELGLVVPSALIDQGVPNILGPLRTRASALWCPLDSDSGYSVVLFPFIHGKNAKVAGMSDEQWRTFGSTLRAIHDSAVGEQLGHLLHVEAFALPSAAKVRRLLAMLDGAQFESPAATQLAAFFHENTGRIRGMLTRAEELGAQLQSRSFEFVLCHGDIHAANVLVGSDGRIFLTDWDGPPEPLIAPRERDLLFVVGSRIARVVQPREEALFFEGYGPVEIDPSALAYFRYERIVEDIGECGEAVLLNDGLGEDSRAAQAMLAMHFFEPGGDVDVAEIVRDHRLTA